MKGYKAFRKGMICDPTGKNPFRYKENTVFEQEAESKICKSGFHFCKNPLDVLDYYPLVDENGDMSEFAEVEALDDVKTDDNKKYCTKKLKIGGKISFPALVQAEINFEPEREPKENANDGDSAKIGSSGDYAKIISSGKHAVICCAGNGSIVKGKKGSWITLSEWKYDEKEQAYVPICVKTEFIDGEKIKEDTFYKLENGNFVEV